MKDLNDEGEKMGEGNWNESDLWQREAEENGLQTEPAVSAMSSAGRWHFSA